MATDNIRPLFTDDRWRHAEEAADPWDEPDRSCEALEAKYGGAGYRTNSVASDEDWGYEPSYYEPPRDTEPERLTHLILVDGRLVDFWSEQVRGTRWEHHARARDAQLAPKFPPTPPTPPAHERMLTWLDGLVGGRAALLALTTAPPTRSTATGETPDGWDQETIDAAAAPVLAALDRTAATWFEEEVADLFREAVRLLIAADAAALVVADSPEKCAGAVIWVVGKANDLLGPGKVVTHGAVARQLGIGDTLAGSESRVHRLLRRAGLDVGRSPLGCPNLLALGQATLLTAANRQRIITWRDAALADAAAYNLSSQTTPPEPG